MSLFTQIQHVSITVTDVEKARDFYTRTLGFQELVRPAVERETITARYGHFALWTDDCDETARTIDADEAQRIGLVNRVVAPEQLDQATEDLVQELLANSHVAVGRAKRVMDTSARPALAQTLELEVAVQEYCVAIMREQARQSDANEDASVEPIGAGRS